MGLILAALGVRELISGRCAIPFRLWTCCHNGCCGSTAVGVYNTPDFRETIHGCSLAAAPAERPIPARPGEFANHADGARHPDRRPDLLLRGPGASDLQRASTPGPWLRRHRRVFRRPAAGR